MENTKRSFRVGIFLLVGIGALFVAVFLLGRKQSLFRSKLHLHASFNNAAGLMVGTPVRLAGVDIGAVESISFDDDLNKRQVHVTLAVANSYAVRVRADSTAQLGSKGLLGDAVIDISVGSASSAPLRDNDAIATQETTGFAEVTREVGAAVNDIRALAQTVKGRVEAVVTDQVAADVGATVHSLAALTNEAQRGNGTLHKLLYDKKLAGQIDEIGTSAQKATADFSRTIASVSDDIDHGRGTVGALLKDPTVYEDMKLLLGNARRNRMLRTLIRYTVNHGGLKAVAPGKAPQTEPPATVTQVAAPAP